MYSGNKAVKLSNLVSQGINHSVRFVLLLVSIRSQSPQAQCTQGKLRFPVTQIEQSNSFYSFFFFFRLLEQQPGGQAIRVVSWELSSSKQTYWPNFLLKRLNWLKHIPVFSSDGAAKPSGIHNHSIMQNISQRVKNINDTAREPSIWR